MIMLEKTIWWWLKVMMMMVADIYCSLPLSLLSRKQWPLMTSMIDKMMKKREIIWYVLDKVSMLVHVLSRIQKRVWIRDKKAKQLWNDGNVEILKCEKYAKILINMKLCHCEMEHLKMQCMWSAGENWCACRCQVLCPSLLF